MPPRTFLGYSRGPTNARTGNAPSRPCWLAQRAAFAESTGMIRVAGRRILRSPPRRRASRSSESWAELTNVMTWALLSSLTNRDLRMGIEVVWKEKQLGRRDFSEHTA